MVMRKTENKIWAVGDIHGRLDLLLLLLGKLERTDDWHSSKLIFLGDMIDRGYESRQVLEVIKKMTEDEPEDVIALAGNHEQLALDCYQDKYQEGYGRTYHDYLQLWDINGGWATRASYSNSHISDEHLDWLRSLPYFHKEPGFFFSHAPVCDEIHRAPHLRGQPFTKWELTWTHHENESEMARHFDEEIGVCGHVHQLRADIATPRLYPHYIFTDSGCGCAKWAPLSAVECGSREIITASPTELDN